MTSREIRKSFLDFFEKKNHYIIPSAPMVIKGDPTLMFTNAGMNQFKDLLLGNIHIMHPRITDSQKCLRVSGKHNDLEEVGHDTYHHTMFEMLGNWSFGDYFKKETIEWAWELLTEVFKLDKDRLYATIFEGSKDDGLELDNEAKEIWEKFLPENRIINGNKHDNFWEMGDMGPCGPCSEIHYDLRDDEDRNKIPGEKLVNKGHSLVIEIWNLVFTQYNRKADGSLEELPNKNVDTGMGLERLVMVINHKKSNYEGDIFQNLIAKISEISGKKYGDNEEVDIAMRVISDHIRAISFSIADGQLPSNVKAGYVIRRILRRAVRYGYTFLGFDSAFLCKLVPTLTKLMGDTYPELVKQQNLIEKVIREEEDAFLRTLDKGISLMDKILKKSADTKKISGKDAFTLYDTFGFPIDLSQLIASENSYTIDLKEFEIELQKQKNRARNASIVEKSDWQEIKHVDNIIFTGYDHLEENCKIVKYRTINVQKKKLYQIVLDKTPFYAEKGGQIGDTGYIITPDEEKIIVTNTVNENNLPIHTVNKLPKIFEGTFHAVVNVENRADITANHSSTHLLHSALRKILGTHVEQKGSSVNAKYFRFDFSHFEKISDEDLRKIEREVNNMIRQHIEKEEYRDVPIQEAKDLGAMALFGEKYGDKVRVIKYGDSIELCGGTHVTNTSHIGMFKILSESASAAGIRRIEATTGRNIENLMYQLQDTEKEIRNILQTSDILSSIKKFINLNNELKEKADNYQGQIASILRKKLETESEVISGVKVIKLNTGKYPTDMIKDIAFQIYKATPKDDKLMFAAGFGTPEGKVCLTLMYSDALVKTGMDASKNIKVAAKFIQGGGGGQKFLATAGGRNINGINNALETLINILNN
ncbi:MAG: alanine--tRNA ligase [Bacteroidales bacterium]